MRRGFLLFTVFITGMSVTAVELTASRLLAPYFGASLFVWTSIIGVVLLALSIGYYAGGRLADRNHGKTSPKVLYPLIFSAGILIVIIPFVGKPVFIAAYNAIPERSVSIFLASLIATLILFTIPILILGMVSPLAAKISLNKLNAAGSVIGSLYAFSTLGSIIGTFLPVLFTIPFMGSRETFFLFGGLLMLLGAIGIKRAVLFSALAIPIVLFLIPASIHAAPNLEFEGESVYNYIRVQKSQDGARALFTNEGEGLQSLYHPFRILTGYYWDAATFLPALNPQGRDFLILGLAGGSSARILYHFFPYLNMEGVEIDPLMIKVGREFFASGQIPMAVRRNDGRVFLEHTDKKYDFIMIDAYRDELYIPFHLATKEFFELAGRRLTDNGAVIMNIAASQDSELLRLIRNTITAVFPFTYEFKTPNSSNSIIFAFLKKPDFQNFNYSRFPLDLETLISQILRGIHEIKYDPAVPTATDNRSAVEFLTEKMIFSETL